MQYVSVNESEKLSLDPHHKLKTSRGSTLVHAYHVVNVFVSYPAHTQNEWQNERSHNSASHQFTTQLTINLVLQPYSKSPSFGLQAGYALTIIVQGQDVMAVEEFVYLSSFIRSTTGNTCDISRRSAITRAAMQSLGNQIWRSRLTTATKLKLYNMRILPIFLYGSDCWAISKTDARKIDALDQWCLCMLLGIKWYQSVRNNDVRRLMKQPKLTAIIQSRRLTLFWAHCMNGWQCRCQEDPVSLP